VSGRIVVAGKKIPINQDKWEMGKGTYHEANNKPTNQTMKGKFNA